MKLRILEDALKHYMLSADCNNEDRQEVESALTTCVAVAERYDDRELWQDSVQLITTNTLMDLLNTTTYDIYGKLARTNNGEVAFSEYAHAVRENTFLRPLTNGQLYCGYDFISDLWSANECTNNNNADGTFKR